MSSGALQRQDRSQEETEMGQNGLNSLAPRITFKTSECLPRETLSTRKCSAAIAVTKKVNMAMPAEKRS